MCIFASISELDKVEYPVKNIRSLILGSMYNRELSTFLFFTNSVKTVLVRSVNTISHRV